MNPTSAKSRTDHFTNGARWQEAGGYSGAVCRGGLISDDLLVEVEALVLNTVPQDEART